MTQVRMPEVNSIVRRLTSFFRSRISEIAFLAAFTVILWLLVPKGISAKDIGILVLTGISTLIGALYAFRLT